ncbi:MAG: entericidin A/B family lipoprotein [Alphaproteobacteria bacterium]|nr:entericidin A/B family lipoprotein [Alphaproteobacteria bacterium]
MLSALILGVSVVGGLAGCNTIEGAGEDLEAAGRAIEDTAEKASN